ncbi:MAG: LLM class flavin-dependent oxidoreductase [Actinomycetota bacterium]|nr:LLM class flavin-dependent oxidoreductase [Actinomycetota bacterium]
MKVRIGVILGIDGGTEPEPFSEAVAAMEDLGFDSLWLAERLSTAIPDVVAGLAFAAARTTRLKLGTGVVVLPGRNPAVVAKQLATLDRLSGGRLLVAFGSGVPDPTERALRPIPPGGRGQVFDEALVAVRAYLEPGSAVRPAPVQQPLDLWVGGNAAAALSRAGRLADGWLPSLISPDEARRGRKMVEAEAEKAGRRIDPEHFGVTFFYADNGLPDALAAAIARRRPGIDPAILVPSGLSGAVDFIGECLEAGFSKFVVRPAVTPVSWSAALEAMAEALLPLQT